MNELAQLLREAAEAIFFGASSQELSDKLNAAAASLVAQEPSLFVTVGKLPTVNQDEYPGLGDWWVQLRTGEGNDEVFARVYGDSPNEARERACIVRDALGRPPTSAVPEWQPIETAPKDNKRPLLLAQFSEDGRLVDLDVGGVWESESESWEMPKVYYFWASAYGRVEEPTHWMYEPEWLTKTTPQQGGSDSE